MTMEENESVVVYDYAERTVGIYTTRYGVRNQIIERVGEDNILSFNEIKMDGKAVAWDMRISMDHCRGAFIFTKVVKD